MSSKTGGTVQTDQVSITLAGHSEPAENGMKIDVGMAPPEIPHFKLTHKKKG